LESISHFHTYGLLFFLIQVNQHGLFNAIYINLWK
jgi:hypothetical protein